MENRNYVQITLVSPVISRGPGDMGSNESGAPDKMEQWRYVGLLAILLIGIHLTRADEGYIFSGHFDKKLKNSFFMIGDNEKGKCKSGNYTQYLKTNENVKVTFCAGEDDGKICRISLEKEKVSIEYCFIFKDKENKTQ